MLRRLPGVQSAYIRIGISSVGNDNAFVMGDFQAKNFSNAFKLGAKLGQAGSCKVFKCTLKKAHDGPQHYAVKRVRRWGLRESAKKALLQEVNILRELDHPNVIAICQFYPKNATNFFMVMELAAGGELLDRVSRKSEYNEEHARDTCLALIDAIYHCHRKGIVHRDLNPSNILLASKDEDAAIKVIGFGSACSVLDGYVTTKCLTPDFAPPEVLLEKPHGKSVDMWSLGLIFFILLGGYHPFYHKNTTKMFIRVAAGDWEFTHAVWDNISEEAKDFVSQLLKVDPAKRMTAEQAATHPWLLATGQGLARRNLDTSLQQIKIFQAKRRLRAMIRTVIVANRMLATLGPGKFSDDFVIGDKLGEGAYAVVFKATAVRQQGSAATLGGGSAGSSMSSSSSPGQYAVKRIARKDLTEEDERSVYDEARILGEMNHPNVMKIHRLYTSDPVHYYMVLELMAGGELLDRIVKKKYYNEEEARNLCRILLGAIKYIHGQDVVHRDLKPENLLLASPSDDESIRLADFGFACSVRDGFVKDACGTPAYVAPEILRGKEYGTSVDMWSMGVIIYIILAGYRPFDDMDQARLRRKIKAGVFRFHDECWSEVSNEAKDIIKKLLRVNPMERITAAEALEHPWLSTEGPSLAGHDLGLGLKKLKIFNARRKLRAAIQSVLLTKRFALILG